MSVKAVEFFKLFSFASVLYLVFIVVIKEPTSLSILESSNVSAFRSPQFIKEPSSLVILDSSNASAFPSRQFTKEPTSLAILESPNASAFLSPQFIKAPTSLAILESSNASAFPSRQPIKTHHKQKSRTDSLKATAVPEGIRALPPNFRLSGRAFPTLHFGDKPAEVKGLAWQPRYQCAGKPYEYFMNIAFRFVLNKVHKESSGIEEEGWGRRSSIVPPPIPAKKSRNILMFGNSHARQTAMALEWQYANTVQSFQSDVDPSFASNHIVETFSFFDPSAAGNFTLTFTGVFNYPCVYSARWKENLEQDVLNSSLSDFDAIVLGRFNPFSEHFKTCKQWTLMEMYKEAHPKQQINMAKNPNAFSLEALANIYLGPIVSISSFNLADQRYHNKNVETIRNLTAAGRTNLRHVNARKYIPLIGNGECSSDNFLTIDTCGNRTGSHRCMGAMGGVPDFAAWDLVEALHDVLSGA